MKILRMTFFLEGTKKIQHAPSAHLKRSVTEAVSYDSPENPEEHRICKPGDNLESPSVNETEEVVDNVKCLTLSDRKQRSWLERILRPFLKEMCNSNDTRRKNKDKIGPQIQATILDYLENLQIEYQKEKTKWVTQVDILKQRVCSLMSELQDVKSANRKANEQLTNLKTFYCQNKSVVGRNFDIDQESQMMSFASEKPNPSQQKYAIEKDHTDNELACSRTNHSEIERNNQETTSEKFRKFINTKDREGSLSLQQSFSQKPSMSKKINTRNLLVPKDCKKLKLSINLKKKLEMEARMRNKTLSLSEKFLCANPLDTKSPRLKHPLFKTSNSMNENSSRETCDNFLKDHKSGWKWATSGDDRKRIPIREKSSGVSLNESRIKQRSQQIQVERSLTTEIPNEDTLTFGNTSHKAKIETKTLNERVSKVNEEAMLFDWISRKGTVLPFQGDREILSRSQCRITIRSTWL